MHIKILVPENRRNDLKRFIDCCTEHGFTVTTSGGGHMPSFSGYFAELKGDKWGMDEPTPKETPVKPPKKLAAVFLNSRADFKAMRFFNNEEWQCVKIESTKDLIDRKFHKVMLFDGWEYGGFDIMDALDALRHRQPELFTNTNLK